MGGRDQGASIAFLLLQSRGRLSKVCAASPPVARIRILAGPCGCFVISVLRGADAPIGRIKEGEAVAFARREETRSGQF
ncbi:MAG: hypothetical protein D6757_00695 [Alphaproteobacteria bacterium]|nr:MAG: hypothetical protein D6757_00695 [Alphaproteobacteria bacterium]